MLQHEILHTHTHLSSLPALCCFVPPTSRSNSSNIGILIPLALPAWCHISPRAHQGLSLGPSVRKWLFLALSIKGGSESCLGYPGITGQSSAKGSSACGLRAGRCGSRGSLFQTQVFCPRKMPQKGSLGVCSQVWCKACTRTALPMKQLAGMLCHNYQEASSSGPYFSGAFQVGGCGDSAVETSLRRAAAGKVCLHGLFSVMLPQLSLLSPP